MVTKKKLLKKSAPPMVDENLERWKRHGATLAKAKNGNQWAIADWMLEGEDGFKEKIAYKAAASVTGMEIETLRTFAFVARNVSTRVDGLSFGHHRLVAGIKDPKKQMGMLQIALTSKPKYSVAKF